MRILDVFAGLGGFSAAFADAGHQVETLDNGTMKGLAHAKWTYTMDVRKFHGRCGQFDMVLIGLPCQEYSRWGMRGIISRRPQNAPIKKPSDELLLEAIRILNECQPRYWALENVRAAVPFISEFLGKPKLRIGSRHFWGVFPLTQEQVQHSWCLSKRLMARKPIGRDAQCSHKQRLFDRMLECSVAEKLVRPNAALRSLIEYDISKAFCDAIA